MGFLHDIINVLVEADHKSSSLILTKQELEGALMNTESAYCNHTKINPDIKTAVIYSTDDLFVYIVEVKKGDNSYFICSKDNMPVKFGNMEDARQAALNENVQEAYLALSKTYEENDLSTCHASHRNHYDYCPVVLQSKD